MAIKLAINLFPRENLARKTH